MKFKTLFLILFLQQLNVFSQNQIDYGSSIFIFTRSTSMKAAYIAEDFNLKDSLATHIGIGFRVNTDYQIYNVTNEKTYSDCALICDNLESFIQIDGLQYYAIWEFKASDVEIKRMRTVLDEYLKLPIVFDYDFALKKDNALYCSEFVNIILQEIDGNKFCYTPIKKKLADFYKNLLQRDTLEYIPVDFFLDFNCFEVIESNFFN